MCSLGNQMGSSNNKILKMLMSTICSFEWTVFMSWEWEAQSYATITCMPFKEIPVRKKMNLIHSLFSICFSKFFRSMPCSLSHVDGCVPGTQPYVHSHDGSPKLKRFRALKESPQDQAGLPRLITHLGPQTVTKSWKSVYLHDSRPRRHGFQRLLHGEG